MPEGIGQLGRRRPAFSQVLLKPGREFLLRRNMDRLAFGQPEPRPHIVGVLSQRGRRRGIGGVGEQLGQPVVRDLVAEVEASASRNSVMRARSLSVESRILPRPACSSSGLRPAAGGPTFDVLLWLLGESRESHFRVASRLDPGVSRAVFAATRIPAVVDRRL